jgi:hypothetical protein
MKRGRPKLPRAEAKGTLFAVRVAKADAEKIQSAIKRSGLPSADWQRKALLRAAET